MIKKDCGVLVVVSGFSGAGKGTVIKELMKKYDNYALSVSMTTRAPRSGEVDGLDYFFVSREEFKEKINSGGLLEHASYCDNFYGTPRSYVEEKISTGNDVVLEIEIQGALKVKRKFPQAVLVFVMPPSAEELKKRLFSRATESPENIEKRMQRASKEAVGIEEYDYILINDDLQECVENLHATIQGSKNVPSRNKELINKVRKELKDLYK